MKTNEKQSAVESGRVDVEIEEKKKNMFPIRSGPSLDELNMT